VKWCQGASKAGGSKQEGQVLQSHIAHFVSSEEQAMVMMDAFLAGDVSIDFPSERATCRKMKKGQATVLKR
jgi:hypothetical protein